MDKNKKSILMAVGQSGGHVYPALAIAEALEQQHPNIEIHFVYSGSDLCQKILSQTKYNTHKISIGGLASGQRFFRKIKTLFQLPVAFLKAFSLIRKNSFNAVLGTGGSVTGPVLLAAKLNFCYTCIWEGNSHLGLANKCLKPFVKQVFTTFKNVKGLSAKKQIHCGYPLRQSIETQTSQTQNQFKDNIFKVFILGGSQGSVLFNKVLSEALQEQDWRKDIFIYHQTGIKHYHDIQKQYQNLKGVEAFDFSPDIYNYYKESDLIFSRAGSGAIFEIAAFGKSLVLIPLTRSAGGHQKNNARDLYNQKSSEIILEKDFNVESFKNMILSLKNDSEKRNSLASNLSKQHIQQGAKTIASHIVGNL